MAITLQAWNARRAKFGLSPLTEPVHVERKTKLTLEVWNFRRAKFGLPPLCQFVDRPHHDYEERGEKRRRTDKLISVPLQACEHDKKAGEEEKEAMKEEEKVVVEEEVMEGKEEIEIKEECPTGPQVQNCASTASSLVKYPHQFNLLF